MMMCVRRPQSRALAGLLCPVGSRKNSSSSSTASSASSASASARAAAEDVNVLIEEMGRRAPQPLTIRDLMATSRASRSDDHALLRSGQFLQKELPVRLARRLKDMQNLPYIVGMNPYVQSVYSLYRRSFEELSRFPLISSVAQEREYTSMLTRLVDEHKDVVPILSKGMMECKRYISPAAVKVFLDRKIHDRIGIRVLAEQHIALHSDNHTGYAGIINTRLNPTSLIQGVGKSAQVKPKPYLSPHRSSLFLLFCFFFFFFFSLFLFLF